jgi:molybdopterin/thiamine biosynthesis adenylyltransferase
VALPPDDFARIAGRVDLQLLGSKLVVIVGVGTVGSQLGRELANCGIGRLRLIDGDYLERPNLVRHVLGPRFVAMNKAEGMALQLSDDVPSLHCEALGRYVDDSLADADLDGLLHDADLIIIATDDRVAQRRVARRALALDTPAVLPALYGNDGGETFVQLSPRQACFLCWDGFRLSDERLRGVEALNADVLSVIELTVHLCLGLLDPRSEFARLLAGSPTDPRPRQLFVQRHFAALSLGPVDRRPNCPSCGVGPAPTRMGSERRLAVDAPASLNVGHARERFDGHRSPGAPNAWAETLMILVVVSILAWIAFFLLLTLGGVTSPRLQTWLNHSAPGDLEALIIPSVIVGIVAAVRSTNW